MRRNVKHKIDQWIDAVKAIRREAIKKADDAKRDLCVAALLGDRSAIEECDRMMRSLDSMRDRD